MQRWIVAGVLVLCLLLGGGAFAYWKIKQNGPDHSYVPLPFNPESTEEQREQTVKEMKEKLLTKEILTQVVRDCDITNKWKLASEEVAVEDIKRRIIFEAGETKIKGIPTATLNIGFKGKVSEHKELVALAHRLMADVERLVTPQKAPDAEPNPAKF